MEERNGLNKYCYQQKRIWVYHDLITIKIGDYFKENLEWFHRMYKVDIVKITMVYMY